MNKITTRGLLALSISTAITLIGSSAVAESQNNTASASFGTALMDAADSGNISEVANLISSGYNPNEAGEFGATPLMRAVHNNNLPLVKLLLSNGARTDIKDIGGATALSIAAREGHDEILKTLVINGANLNSTDEEGFTPLMRASMASNEQAVKFLIRAGAKVNAANNYGQSALGQAKNENNTKIVALLTNSGADDAQIEMPQLAPRKAEKVRLAKAQKLHEVADNEQTADINLDFTQGRLHDQVNAARAVAPVYRTQQVADIKPSFTVSGFYVPKKTPAPEMASPASDIAGGMTPIIPGQDEVANSTPINPSITPITPQAEIEVHDALTQEVVQNDVAEDKIDIPAKPQLVDAPPPPAPKPLVAIDSTPLTIPAPAKIPGPVVADAKPQASNAWLKSLRQIADVATKPYQISSNEMVFPGNSNLLIDLGNFKSEAFANNKIAKLKSQFPEIFSMLPVKVIQKGSPTHIFYQINAGIFNTDEQAEEVCKKLITSGVNCRPVETNLKSQLEFNNYNSDLPAATATAAPQNPADAKAKADLMGAVPSPKVEAKSLNAVAPVAATPSTPADAVRALPKLETATDAKSLNQLSTAADNPETSADPARLAATTQEHTELKSVEPTKTLPVVSDSITPVAPTPENLAPKKVLVGSSPTPVNNTQTPAIMPDAVKPTPIAPTPIAPTPVTPTPAVEPVSAVTTVTPTPTMMPVATSEAAPAVTEAPPAAATAAAPPPPPEAKTEEKKPVRKPIRHHRIPAATPGTGTPPKDLTTGQPLVLNQGDGKFEVARPVKSADAGGAPATSAWIHVSNFRNDAAAHEFVNNLRAQGAEYAALNLKTNSPLTRPNETTAEIGPFTSDAATQNVCASLAQNGMDCTITGASRPTVALVLTDIVGYQQGGEWIVQLGSYDNEQDAMEKWNDYSKGNKALKKMTRDIVPANGKYRLRTGSFASSAQADSLCDQLRTKSISCIIVRAN